MANVVVHLTLDLLQMQTHFARDLMLNREHLLIFEKGMSHLVDPLEVSAE
jgi:hypothetical protein